jgi:mitochondrial fission protein ELM1
MKRLLVLTDGKAGHENQSKAFARALGGEAVLTGVRFRSKACKALSYLVDRLGLRCPFLFTTERAVTAADGYAAVIGTGSGTFYAAKTLARRLGVACGVVLYPRGYRLSSFDCILAPSFDRPAPAPNLIEIPANLVAADAAFYAAGVEAFAAHYARTTGRALDRAAPAVAVIIGGPNARAALTVDWMRAQLDALFARKEADGTAPRFWVTTSRRTPPAVEALVASYPWDYALLYSRDRFNPIPGFVALARRLCVTAESTGMLSEACTSGAAEVVALDNLAPGRHKFRRFLAALTRDGYVGGARKIDLSDAFRRARRLMRL